MKKVIISFMLSFVLLVTSAVCFTACNKGSYTPEKRISLSLTDKIHVEYQNDRIIGFATLPTYCMLVKEGDYYYVKTPTRNYSSNRLEVYEKINLKNGVVFADPQYTQGYISACWRDGGFNSWLSAENETESFPLNSQYHANDQNNEVCWTGISFLDSGYEDVNHPYENGVESQGGYKHTATQKANETLTVGENQFDCIVWEYEFTAPDVWSKSKYWFDAETHVILKQTSVLPSSANQSLDADENIGLKATYFSKTETMQSYLESINRWPAPDFSAYI